MRALSLTLICTAFFVAGAVGMRIQGQPRAAAQDEQRIDAIIAVAEEVDPALAERLHDLREKQPPAVFARSLRANARNLEALVRLREDDPALYDMKVTELRLDARAKQIRRQLREAEGSSIAQEKALRERLFNIATEQVAISIGVRGMYINRLNRHVDRLREELTDDINGFPAAVDRRFQALLDE